MTSERTSMAGRLILIAEDEPLIALDISCELQRYAAEVVLARTLSEGLRLIRDNPLSIAIIDQQLGFEDADELCEALSAREVPFIVYSGRSCDGACLGGEFLSKPADPDVLIGKVFRMLTPA